MNEVNDLIFNLMIDLKKKEISNHARAKLIRRYLENTKISERQLAKEIGIPRATLCNWLKFERISEKEYEEKINAGYTKTEVFESLKKFDYAEKISLNEKIKRDIVRYNLIKKHIKKEKFNNETVLLIDEFKSVLDGLKK